MNQFFSRAADWAVQHRSHLPRWVGTLMESAARNPDGLIGRLSAKLLGGGGDAPVTAAPANAVRVYIAPTNYSGQGFAWARALERADPHIGARNMAVALPGGFAFPADTLVPISAVNGSSEWGRAEWTVASTFTHVLVEAERSMFGRQFGRDLKAEVTALDEAGVSVAFLCHGTDVRDPDHHSQLTPWSMYPDDPRTNVLRTDARENLALLRHFNRPTFISTPDLITDVPYAIWCPVVIDADRFATANLPFSSGPPKVVHAASNPLAKGSPFIEPALAELIASGEIEYELITGTPFAKMPELFAQADIVIDQFRVGSYGVAACEAMAAGRVVIGHVLASVREYVERETGMPLPIVEATPDSLSKVISSLISDPRRARSYATQGIEYVRLVHSGQRSAEALRTHWINL